MKHEVTDFTMWAKNWSGYRKPGWGGCNRGLTDQQRCLWDFEPHVPYLKQGNKTKHKALRRIISCAGAQCQLSMWAARLTLMLKNMYEIFLNQLSAATDRICSLQKEQQQLREQNEVIRERSEKSVEVRG
jgi:hypothetical protein